LQRVIEHAALAEPLATARAAARGSPATLVASVADCPRPDAGGVGGLPLLYRRNPPTPCPGASRLRCRKLRRLGNACLLGLTILALAGPAAAVAQTRAAGPTPDPSPTTGSGNPAPQPVPQPAGTGGGGSQPSQTPTSQGSTAPASSGSGLSSGSVPQPEIPSGSGPAVGAPSSRLRGTSGAGSTARGQPRTPGRSTQNAANAASRHEAVLELQGLRHRLAALQAHALVLTSVGAVITSAPAHRNGTLLLIGAGVLLVLVAVSGTLLRALWRLHGEWYGGRAA
jgi:hypothetical protein